MDNLQRQLVSEESDLGDQDVQTFHTLLDSVLRSNTAENANSDPPVGLRAYLGCWNADSWGVRYRASLHSSKSASLFTS